MSLLLLVLFFSAGSALFAQGLTLEHVTKIKSVTSSITSDDGSKVAYTVSVPADPYEENAGSSTELHVLNVETGETKPYHTTGGIGSIQFRPGHNSLSFLTQREEDDSRSLYELPLDGGEAVKIFEYDRNISSYEWHNDGNHIVFSSTLNAETSDSPLPYKANVYEANRPQRPAYITNVSHDHMDHEPHQLQVDGTVYMMKWSPDGSKIAVSAAPTPSIDDFYMAQSVYIVDYETREVAAEVNNEGKIGQIEWSPDGERLALRAGADIHDPIDGRILIVSADGGTPSIIDEDYEGKYEQIVWTGNNQIHFLASESTASVIGSINPNGSNKQTIFRSDEHSIGSFSRSDNGLISFVASSPEHPNELFVKQSGRNAQPERVTNHNDWLSDVELGEQKVVTYTTRDGEFDIDGVMIYPLDYSEGDRIPVITVVHGGPEAHYDNGWLTAYSMPGQMAAAKGYGVFYPNYRGSTGRGIEFAYSSQGDLAGAEFDDIVDGVDYLINQGVADADRIGVTGGSYGGYASGWMATHYSDRFAASVMFVGISNNISKWGTSDIPDELFLVHTRERMWESDETWMDYLKRSPIYWVDRAETPILIMHGAEDTRVHPAQSLELYRHMKVRKPEVPVRLVYYPGEGHGNTRASSRLDYSHRMLRWFDTYLMTGDASADIPEWDAPIPAEDQQ
ncbi:S9 family peptidase [Rhodohalobacter sp. 8-1]|uniref:S9 family peptidase n=1 Tax=Rhodohalobacter sp. 8-1 TaxID=3131972 RepID=UPI0030EC2018